MILSTNGLFSRRAASRPALLLVATLLVLLGATGGGHAQVPGQNVNMVSGTQWPGGDPFLQRQNEPSIAVSTRNPDHLIAGANDYRTVDLPGLPDDGAIGDAWLGVFKSWDGGQTWQSTLLPGFPQDTSPEGMASPLYGYSAAADPVVRAGTHGMFYYLGIAFNRGSNKGQVFVARYIDLNNKENGDVALSLDSTPYGGAFTVDSGTSGQFLDKPWIAIKKHDENSGSCIIPTDPPQVVPADEVFVAFSKFTGSNTSKIMITSSKDCGVTWSHPVKLSESNTLNQGVSIAIDPVTDAIYVAWRRFETSSNSHAIVYARSTDGGKRFNKAREIAQVIPFDQGMTPSSFRTNAYPSLAVSVEGSNSWIHAAWTQRMVAGGDARVVMSTSANGRNWSAPVAVDDDPIIDDFGNSFSRGHQFMPAITFSAGKLMLLFYDVRLDHTLGLYTPNEPFLPDALGRYYREERAVQGELPDYPDLVFGPYLDEAGMLLWRHTIDVRVAQADPGPAPDFNSERVSNFRFGTRGDEYGTVEKAKQLQVNPPNLPLYGGTLPFIGDYIDIAGLAFLPPETPDGEWRYNLDPVASPVHYAVWTSNQDVRPPRDGDWTNYTPVGGGGSSVYSPGNSSPSCVPGQEGMRNQNIYSAKISQGLRVSSPQNTKPLSTTLTRAFVINAHNFTDEGRVLRLSILDQPVDGKASFLQFPGPGDPDPMLVLDLAAGARSGVSRSVFTTSSDPAAQVRVSVDEVTEIGGEIVAGGLSGFITFNPDPTVPELVNPDGVSGSDIALVEIYSPSVTNPNVLNPNVLNPNVLNGFLTNPDIDDPNVRTPNVLNSYLAEPGRTETETDKHNIANPATTNPVSGLSNFTATAVTDAVYTVTNEGNTTASYRVKLVGETPEEGELQLLIAKNYTTPMSVDCELASEAQNIVMANVPDPIFEDTGTLTDPRIEDPELSNGTFWLRPGETALITLRGTLSLEQMEQVASRVAPVIVPHASPTYDSPLFVNTDSLPAADVGQPYSALLEAIGADSALTWSVESGALPADLVIDPDSGEISGTPAVAGDFPITILVTDEGDPPAIARRDLVLTVNPAATTTMLESSANPSVFGQPVTFTATVETSVAGLATPDGSVSFEDGGVVLGTAVLDGGVATLTTADLAVGDHDLVARYGGSSSFETSDSATLAQAVNKAETSVALSSSLNPSVLGVPVTFTAMVAAASPGAGMPTGTVTFEDGGVLLGSADLDAGVASLTAPFLALATHSITATYAGDGNFEGAVSSGLDQVVLPAATTTSVASSVNPAAFGQPVTFTATVAAVPVAAGLPAGSVTFMNGAESLGSATLTAGSAGLTVASLAVGTHAITAVYAGEAAFTGSSSSALSQVVEAANTATTLISLANPTVLGETATFAVTVVSVPPGSGTPTGIVRILDGGVELGNVSLAAGTAEFSTTALAPGDHTITAVYDGDGSFASSTATAVLQNVGRAASLTTLAASPATISLGEPVTFTATVSPASPIGVVASGTVTFTLGAASLGSADLAAGVATLTTTGIPGGTSEVVATYAGDTNLLGSTSAPVVVVVVQPSVYEFIGFAPPLGPAGTYDSPTFADPANLGSDVPIKWRLNDLEGNPITDRATLASLRAERNGDCAGAPEGPGVLLYSLETGPASNTFKFDKKTQQFVFNWDTSTVEHLGPGCYSLILELDDGSAAKVVVIDLQ